MPDLRGVHDFLKKPLRWEFNLNGVEHPESWEGWLKYETKLSRGEDVVAYSANLMIHEDDIKRLYEHLDRLNAEEFEPMEPDFQMLLRQSSFEDNVTLLIFLDEGRNQSGGYTGQGVGLRLVVSKAEIRSFTKDLKGQHNRLTRGLNRVD